MRALAAIASLTLVSACGSKDVLTRLTPSDAGIRLVLDAGHPDARQAPSTDAVVAVDAVVADADAPEIAVDASAADAAAPDASAPDATAPDATAPDAIAPDAIVPDAAAPDAFVPDALPAGDAQIPECTSNSDCDDHNVCTNDSCSLEMCIHSPAQCPTICPSQNCSDVCSVTTTCGVTCPIYSCGPTDCCILTPFGPTCIAMGADCTTDAQCDDGNACTRDTCNCGRCEHGQAPCLDATCGGCTPCTTPGCNWGTECCFSSPFGPICRALSDPTCR
jgi:hypothetical protein